MPEAQRRRKLSIHDVARRAGVAASTVSRVLNGGQVSPTTRAKVMAVLEATRFRPDIRATSLRKGGTQTVGLVIPDITNPFYALTARQVHDRLRARGYSLLLCCTYGALEEELLHLDLLERERVDGIILHTCEGEDDLAARKRLEGLIAGGTPLVFVGKQPMGLAVDVVNSNCRAAIANAVRLLHQTGRKRIGFIAGPPTLSATADRLECYRQAMAALGLPAPAERILTGESYTIESGESLARELIERKRVDALLCGNDLMAIGALQAAERLGQRVPDDLALVGIDDSPLASIARPRLTTLRLPLERLTEGMVELLLKRIDGDTSAPRHLNLEAELIVRDST